jgi:hypothetical protein
MAVSLTTEHKLRGVMDRLCNGTSQRTNGQLTVSNLAKEAGVSRATANRAQVVLSDFHKSSHCARGDAREASRSARAKP